MDAARRDPDSRHRKPDTTFMQGNRPLAEPDSNDPDVIY
jgi:hypothetical protein